MELKKIHMGTLAYGMDAMDQLAQQLAAALDMEVDSGTRGKRQRHALPGHVGPPVKGRRDMSYRVADIVKALALCHNVTPVLPTGGETEVTYQASSPDEVAIVKWTESVGLVLVDRDLNTMRLEFAGQYGPRKVSSPNIRNDGHSQAGPISFEYEILQVFPFTSETKRMGIIVRDHSTGEITFYEKGADAVMSQIVQYNDWLEEECGNMAREGLRTLVIGRKRLSEESYREFEQRYRDAKVSIHDRSAQMQTVISQLLENDLELLGLTGVEDKLQNNVKNTLELLRNAGLKIWMLTGGFLAGKNFLLFRILTSVTLLGDKIETATCIAISSKLVARNQLIHQTSQCEYSFVAN